MLMKALACVTVLILQIGMEPFAIPQGLAMRKIFNALMGVRFMELGLRIKKVVNVIAQTLLVEENTVICYSNPH